MHTVKEYIDTLPTELRTEIRESKMHPVKCGLPIMDEAYFAMFGPVIVDEFEIEIYKSIIDGIWRGEIPTDRE